MNKFNKVTLGCTSVLLTQLLSQSALAHGNPPSKQDTYSGESELSGGYLKLGVGLKNRTGPFENDKHGFATFVSGRYQFENGVFVEVNEGANEFSPGLSVGYNFHNTPHWSFDVNLIEAHGSTDLGATITIVDDAQNLRQEFKRDLSESATHMVALRASGQYDNSFLQFVVAPATSLNKDIDGGYYVSAWAAQSWQWQNVELHASVGLQYRSSDILTHYYGFEEFVFESQQLNDPIIISEYEASGGINAVGQIGFSYPITQDWLLEGYVRHMRVSRAIIDSPAFQNLGTVEGRDDKLNESALVLSYVF